MRSLTSWNRFIIIAILDAFGHQACKIVTGSVGLAEILSMRVRCRLMSLSLVLLLAQGAGAAGSPPQQPKFAKPHGRREHDGMQ